MEAFQLSEPLIPPGNILKGKVPKKSNIRLNNKIIFQGSWPEVYIMFCLMHIGFKTKIKQLIIAYSKQL